jgi:hypothetical protein
MTGYSPYLVFLELLAGYVLCGFIALIGLVVAWNIATGKIDISNILLEKDGSGNLSASMARFQLLIFVFVIAISFFLVVISNIKILQAKGGGLPVLPEVPSGVMALLGISASSYAVGKAIQNGAGTGGNDGDGAHRPAAPVAGQPPVVR